MNLKVAIGPGRIPLREFSQQPLLFGHVFHVISILCLHHAHYKIHTWNLCSWRSKGEESPWYKEKEKKQAQRRKKVPFCQEKKKFLCESDWYWRSSTLGSRFRTKKSPSNQNLPYRMFKMRFPLLYAITSLETKSLTITSNCDFESCMAIRCLASQHIFRFYHFFRGFFLCFWHFCSLLCRPPQRSLSDRDKTINVSAIVTFPRKSWSIVIGAKRFCCPLGLRFQEAR